MKPQYIEGNVRTTCPDCEGALSTYCNRPVGGNEFGAIARDHQHLHEGLNFSRYVYRLMKCGGCARGALAVVHCGANVDQGVLGEFYPTCQDRAPLPDGVPNGVVSEYREAELCASVGAFRGASALLRSALEKTFMENGYKKGGRSELAKWIDEAASEGVITSARKQLAHKDVRVLGNDILHDEWREVKEDEYSTAHQYVQRILEDFYLHRPEVVAILIRAKRLSQQEDTKEEAE